MNERDDLWERIEALNLIGVALSTEKDPDRLLETIVLGAKRITGADGGTLYTLEEDRLKLAIVHTDSLRIALGGTTGEPVPFPPIPLHHSDGAPNLHNVATCAVLQGRTINIGDAYAEGELDFSGTRAFDEQTGYRSRSFLAIPLKDHENEIIGLLQLINPRDAETGAIRPFSTADERLAESLASQAAVAMTTRKLVADMHGLVDSIVRLIASAIDAKSPHTGGHCRRVPELTMLLAEAAHRADAGTLADFSLSSGERYALEIAGWLHDCGKLATPDHVMEKSTKLETRFDRIETIDTRFEVLKRDARIRALERALAAADAGAPLDRAAIEETAARAAKRLEADRRFLRRCNIGSEAPMPEADRERVRRIAAYRWRGPAGIEQPLLSAEEVENLTIVRGTLNAAEREVINDHIVTTIRMLESLPFPKHLANVPEYAGGHHERIDGTGYPRGLRGEQMSVPARAMAIADVFEALTDNNRPYKEGMPLSEALQILGRMSLSGHIDPDLFQVFIGEKVYLEYARRFLDAGQVDAVNETEIPGYRPRANRGRR